MRVGINMLKWKILNAAKFYGFVATFFRLILQSSYKKEGKYIPLHRYIPLHGN